MWKHSFRTPSFVLALVVVSACNDSLDACPQASGLIADSVARFSPADVRCESLPESLALLEPRPIRGAVPRDWPDTPSFTKQGAMFVADLAIDEGTSLYGTGEIAGPLVRNGAITEAWTAQPFRENPPEGSSAFEYDDEVQNLYQAHPWVLAVRPDGSSFGVLADTTYRTRMDLTRGIRFSVPVPFPIIVVDGESPQTVLRKLGEITGTMELPPLWSLGYQQARWSYVPDTRLVEIADEFRTRSIPCDVLWADIEYMDGYRIFTFDPVLFPNPAELTEQLRQEGFESVWILDPGVKAEPGYLVYDEGVEGDHFIQGLDGELFVAGSWPGDSVWPDYTRPETRQWWQGRIGRFLEDGMDGIWVDLNEPSIIFPPGASFPEDLLHRGGGELPPDTHARYHNVYGMLMARATHEGMTAARPERRPFLLSRSNYIGGQRFAAMWTGDNSATWEHLYWSVTMTLNMGLSGQPFAGPDIGGFWGTPTPALYAHWIGVGALFPFSRTHTVRFSPDQEPWSFGPEVEAIARSAIERRYRLLPYLYTLFREASVDGLPVWRPVFFADPSDPALRSEDHAFLLGADVLVLPRLDETASHEFVTPSGIWREVSLVGEDTTETPALPVLKVRGGAIVPLGRVVQSTQEPLLEPLTLLVSLDADGRAEGSLYEDAGEGYDYQLGDYLLTSYAAERVGQTVEVRIASEEGGRARPERSVEVVVVTEGGRFVRTGPETSTIVVPLE